VKTDPYSRIQPVHQAYREFFGEKMSIRQIVTAKQREKQIEMWKTQSPIFLSISDMPTQIEVVTPTESFESS
jgi:hypothetical protein